MESTVVLVGTNPSRASLVGFGNMNVVAPASSSYALMMAEVSAIPASWTAVRRVSMVRRAAAFRWRCLSVTASLAATTDIVAGTDQGNAVANYAFKSEGGGVSGAGSSDVKLKAPAKPVLRSAGDSKSPVEAANPEHLGFKSKGGSDIDGDENSYSDNGRNEVIKTLGVVLEKAEKLESSAGGNSFAGNNSMSRVSGRRETGNVNRMAPLNSARNTNPDNASGNSSVNNQRSKPLKSVWKKGDSLGTAEKLTKQSPSVANAPSTEKSSSQISTSTTGPPIRPQPKLQGKPTVAPPIKKPIILRDVGAAPHSASTEKQPILIDKNARKKPVIDPLIAQAVLAPTKAVKNFAPGKFKDRRKNASPGSPRRRLANDDEDDDDISDAESSPVVARKGRKWSKASRKAARLQAARDAAPVKVEILEIPENGMLVEDLAYHLAISEGEILGLLYSKGIKPDGVQKLDRDIVKMVCKEYEVEVIDSDPIMFEDMARKKEIFDEEDLENLEGRPPVLTIMGHVDHGKTTLLDYIRKSKVVASEAGGITQGIGAYKVKVQVDGNPQMCVFLDTPGHEAFGAMRARGTRVTDIAVIVVAADDGIRPQTNEAIAHARAAGVPIVIAINKIDKEGASTERVMQELSSMGLMPEDWGGDIPMVPISALNGENVDDLLETIMLLAELLELKANPNRCAKGTVIEAGLDKSKGPVVTFIVQSGTLRRGDIVVCGEAFGKVRGLFDDLGKQVEEAGPSIPVQVIGLSNVPMAGDEFEVLDSLDVARERAESHAETLRNERISSKAGDGKITLSSLASAVSAGKLSGLDLHQLNVIMKVDVQGSMEAVKQALLALPQDNVTLKFLLQAPGDVSNSDVDLAVSTGAVIFGFNVKASGSVKSYADNKGVEIRIYKVIYDLIDDVRKAMEGLLEPIEEQERIGSAEVRAVFSSGSGRVAGCMVTEGKVTKGCGVKVVRNRKTVFVGVLDSLRRIKEAVKEVNAGLECGIASSEFDDWQEGDVIETFIRVQKKRTLEEASASMAAALEEAGLSF